MTAIYRCAIRCERFFFLPFARTVLLPSRLVTTSQAQDRSCECNNGYCAFHPTRLLPAAQRLTDEQAAAFVVGAPGGFSGLVGTARFLSWPEGLSPSSIAVSACCGTACTSVRRIYPVFRCHPRATITFCRARRTEGRWGKGTV